MEIVCAVLARLAFVSAETSAGAVEADTIAIARLFTNRLRALFAIPTFEASTLGLTKWIIGSGREEVAASIGSAIVETRWDLAGITDPSIVTCASAANTNSMAIAASQVAKVLTCLGLKLKEHSPLANLALVHAKVTTSGLRTVCASPTVVACAREICTIRVQDNANIADHFLVTARSLTRAVVRAIDNRAIVPTESRVAPACAVHTASVRATAFVWALLERAISTRMLTVAITLGSVVVACSVATAIVGTGNTRAVRRIKA